MEFNDGHIVEGMDRCNTIMVMIEELLINHPAVIATDSRNIVENASRHIYLIYQAISLLDEE